MPLDPRRLRDSPVWADIKAHYEQRLLVLRAKNDGQAAIEVTAFLRGQIAEVKTLLSLADERPTVE